VTFRLCRNRDISTLLQQPVVDTKRTFQTSAVSGTCSSRDSLYMIGLSLAGWPISAEVPFGLISPKVD
jgi:hypothetical protein